MTLKPIGIIHSTFKDPVGTPIQPLFAGDAPGKVEVLSEYADALQNVAGFERVWLIYWFDRAGPARLRVVPFRDTVERGLFATRAPCRPNAIGLSCVRLLSISGNELKISGVDILDGTPLLDIKPYVPKFDAFPQSQAGWLDANNECRTKADARFTIQ